MAKKKKAKKKASKRTAEKVFDVGVVDFGQDRGLPAGTELEHLGTGVLFMTLGEMKGGLVEVVSCESRDSDLAPIAEGEQFQTEHETGSARLDFGAYSETDSTIAIKQGSLKPGDGLPGIELLPDIEKQGAPRKPTKAAQAKLQELAHPTEAAAAELKALGIVDGEIAGFCALEGGGRMTRHRCFITEAPKGRSVVRIRLPEGRELNLKLPRVLPSSRSAGWWPHP